MRRALRLTNSEIRVPRTSTQPSAAPSPCGMRPSLSSRRIAQMSGTRSPSVVPSSGWSAGSTTFGQVTSASGSPRDWQFAATSTSNLPETSTTGRAEILRSAVFFRYIVGGRAAHTKSRSTGRRLPLCSAIMWTFHGYVSIYPGQIHRGRRDVDDRSSSGANATPLTGTLELGASAVCLVRASIPCRPNPQILPAGADLPGRVDSPSKPRC
jgi:hypothetical protein